MLLVIYLLAPYRYAVSTDSGHTQLALCWILVASMLPLYYLLAWQTFDDGYISDSKCYTVSIMNPDCFTLTGVWQTLLSFLLLSVSGYITMSYGYRPGKYSQLMIDYQLQNVSSAMRKFRENCLEYEEVFVVEMTEEFVTSILNRCARCILPLTIYAASAYSMTQINRVPYDMPILYITGIIYVFIIFLLGNITYMHAVVHSSLLRIQYFDSLLMDRMLVTAFADAEGDQSSHQQTHVIAFEIPSSTPSQERRLPLLRLLCR